MLEAAIDASARAAIVCTMGNPTVVVTGLLKILVVADAELHYHGDFDWAGITSSRPAIDLM